MISLSYFGNDIEDGIETTFSAKVSCCNIDVFQRQDNDKPNVNKCSIIANKDPD